MSNLINDIVVESIIEDIDEKHPNLPKEERMNIAQQIWQEIIERPHD